MMAGRARLGVRRATGTPAASTPGRVALRAFQHEGKRGNPPRAGASAKALFSNPLRSRYASSAGRREGGWRRCRRVLARRPPVEDLSERRVDQNKRMQLNPGATLAAVTLFALSTRLTDARPTNHSLPPPALARPSRSAGPPSPLPAAMCATRLQPPNRRQPHRSSAARGARGRTSPAPGAPLALSFDCPIPCYGPLSTAKPPNADAARVAGPRVARCPRSKEQCRRQGHREQRVPPNLSAADGRACSRPPLCPSLQRRDERPGSLLTENLPPMSGCVSRDSRTRTDTPVLASAVEMTELKQPWLREALSKAAAPSAMQRRGSSGSARPAVCSIAAKRSAAQHRARRARPRAKQPDAADNFAVQGSEP